MHGYHKLLPEEYSGRMGRRPAPDDVSFIWMDGIDSTWTNVQDKGAQHLRCQPMLHGEERRFRTVADRQLPQNIADVEPRCPQADR